MHFSIKERRIREISSKVLCSNMLIRQNWERSLAQLARSELMKQEYQVISFNRCIHELQQQPYAQGLELQDAHHGYIEPRREQFRAQEEVSMKEKLLRDTQIRNVPELGEIKKRAQELRVDEFSLQKSK